MPLLSLIIKLLLKSVVILFVLPFLGLIIFHGGLGYAAATSLLISFFGILLVYLTAPIFATALVAFAAAGGRLGIFAFSTLVLSLVMWIVSLFMHGLILVSFWHTVGAAAILALVHTALSKTSK